MLSASLNKIFPSFLCIRVIFFSFQPVLHEWCNKGRGMWYPVCGMVHIKEPLLLIDKSSLCGGSGFSFLTIRMVLNTICLTPYNRRYNVLSASLNKTFLSLSRVILIVLSVCCQISPSPCPTTTRCSTRRRRRSCCETCQS